MLLISFLESFAFLGLIIPGTSLVVFAGVLTSRKIIRLGSLIVAVAVGGILGDAASFYLGKKGTKWFGSHNKFFKTEYLKKGEDFFLKHGNRSVIFARFFGPLRPIIPFVAGMFKMPSQKFFLYNVISAAVSAPLYVGLGFFLGSASGQVEKNYWPRRVVDTCNHHKHNGYFLFQKIYFSNGSRFFCAISGFYKSRVHLSTP
jgi:undecaprenyl-diphosphatase